MSGSRVLSLLLLLVAVGLLAGSAPAAAETSPTFVESNVTDATTWDGDQYRVVANVTVEPGATLAVAPGTTVEFAEGVSLSVAGALTANGTADRPVRLTTSKPVAEPGTWGGIQTAGTDHAAVTLQHVHLSNATDGVRIGNRDSTVRLQNFAAESLAGDGVAIRRAGPETRVTVRSSQFASIAGDGISAARTEILPVETVAGLTVADTAFESIDGAGIGLDAKQISGLSVRGSRFENTGTAVALDGDRVVSTRIGDAEIAGADRGITIDAGEIGTVTLADNDLSTGAVGIDVLAEQNVYGLSLVENRVTGGQRGIAITHDPFQDGFYSFDLAVRGNTVTDHAGDGLVLRSKLFSDSALSLRNNTVRQNGGVGALLAVGAVQDATVANNTFRANGQSGLRMTARHVRDTTVEGNLARDNGQAGIAIRARRAMERVRVAENALFDNAREGLALASGTPAEGTVTVTANRIAANAYGLALGGPQRTAVGNNSIVFNTVEFGPLSPRPDAAPGIGVLVSGPVTDVELAGNDVYGHRVGLLTDVSGTVLAEGNYWGAPNGPYHRSINPEGEGNAVETRRGWVDLVEASPARHGPAYERPTARLSIDPELATVDTRVRLSGNASSDGDGRIQAYQFVVNGTQTITGNPTLTETAERVGPVPVSLRVADDMGIESRAATGTIRVTEPPQTVQPTPSATTPAPPADSGFGTIGLLGGLLGGGLYGVALLLGARGLFQTLRGEFLTVRGRRLHVLSAGGVLVWFAASVPGPPVLRTLAIAGALLWVGLTGLAYLVVRFR